MAQDHSLIKVSLIIPAYNVSGYIDRCIRSALNQTLKEIEVIVINDGSTDDTFSIIDKFKNESKLIIIDQKNAGPAGARNVGIEKASGEYLAFLDADDWMEPLGLSTFYELAKASDLDILITNGIVDDDHGNTSSFNVIQSISDDYLKDIMLEKLSPSIWSKLYKRSLWMNNNIRFIDGLWMGEDLLANIYLFYYAEKISCTNLAFIHYIQRESSITKIYNEKMLNIFNVFPEIRKFLSSKSLLLKYENEVNYLEFLHLFYYRIMIDVKNTKIQKMIYDRAYPIVSKNMNNVYIKSYIQNLGSGERLSFKMFYFNFFLGKIKFLISRYKKIIFS